MQFECRVVGHELVTKKDEKLLKVKLRGVGFQDLKVEVFVAESERSEFPLGITAWLNFSVQQTLAFEKGSKAK